MTHAARSLRGLVVPFGIWLVCAYAPAAGAQALGANTVGLDSLLNTKISTAAKYAQTVTEAASSVTIITADDIERYGYRTVADALNTLAGFYFTDDYLYRHAGTRGFRRPTDYSNRILLLIDGNVTNEAIFGSVVLGNDLGLPIRSLERIEIVRGPGSVLYGTGAVFAVVNLVTKSADAYDGAEANLSSGSRGQRGVSLVTGHRLRNGVEVTLAGEWANADGRDRYFREFDTPEFHNGIAHNLDWERRWNGFATVRRGSLTLMGRYAWQRKSQPVAIYGTDFGAPNIVDRRHGVVQAEYGRSLNAAAHLTARGYFNRYSYAARASGGGLPLSFDDRNTIVGAETNLRWDLASFNRLTVGAELRRIARAGYDVLAYGTALKVSAKPATIASTYLQDEHQLSPAVSVLGGLRYDDYPQFGDALTPRLAAILTPTRASTFKLLYGHAFRAPNVVEGNAERAAFGTAPELQPERVTTYELLWQQRAGSRLVGTLSLYHYTAEQLLTGIADALGVVNRYRNAGRIVANGAEAGVQAQLGRAAGGYANYSYQWATDAATDKQIFGSPAHLVKAGVALRWSRWLQPAVEARYEGPRRTLYATTTDDYVVTDLHVNVGGRPDVGAGKRVLDRLDLSVLVTNLFDVAYAVPAEAQHRAAVLFQDPRAFAVDLRWRF